MYRLSPENLTIKKSTIEDLGLYSTRDIKTGEELTDNYNFYTYPKTRVGFPTL